MQIVIEITDRMYEAIKQDHVPIDIGRFIRNGTSLPKGHGRLIDESEIDWQTDIHDNEYDAENYDFVFEEIFEIIDEYRERDE